MANHGALLNATALNCSGLQAGFNYGTDTNYGTAVNAIVIPDNSLTPFSAPIEGLLPETTYHYQAFAGDVLGVDMTFTTLPDPLVPVVTTLDATNIS